MLWYYRCRRHRRCCCCCVHIESVTFCLVFSSSMLHELHAYVCFCNALSCILKYLSCAVYGANQKYKKKKLFECTITQKCAAACGMSAAAVEIQNEAIEETFFSRLSIHRIGASLWHSFNGQNRIFLLLLLLSFFFPIAFHCTVCNSVRINGAVYDSR